MNETDRNSTSNPVSPPDVPIDMGADPPQPDRGPLTTSSPSAIGAPPPLSAEMHAHHPQDRLQQFRTWLAHTPLFRTRRRTIVTLLVLIPLLCCVGYLLVGLIAFADTARLIQLTGVVQTRHEKETRWTTAEMNQLLSRKHRLRTGEGSGARLLFFDVSTVDLEENTEISIMQIAKRSGGSAVDVVIKTWVGKTAIRAVRFVDPSSTFRVDTPTASTVVRGARFSVQVEDDGTTQIDLEEGTGEVKVSGKVVPLSMGERITLQPSGQYVTEQVFEPDAQPVFDKVDNTWYAPQDTFELKLTESEVNQFLAAMSQESDFMLQDTQVWFVENEMRVATTVVQPRRFDLSTSIGVQVVDGQLEPEMGSLAAGIRLPIPAPVLNLALENVLDQMDAYLAQAYEFVDFEDVQIGNGWILVTGYKRSPDADSVPQ